MPTQFGGNGGNNITTFGGGLSGTGSGGDGSGITIKTFTLTLNASKVITALKQGNITVKATSDRTDAPLLTASIAKTSPTQTPILSTFHNVPSTAGDRLALTWGNNEDLKIHLVVGTAGGIEYDITYY